MSQPAPWAAAVLAQAKVEARLTARRGENLLAMVAVPVAVLSYVGIAGVPPGGLIVALPATLAIALVASGLVNLGIATAYERGYGVLKRLGGSPLGSSGYVAAKLGVVLGIASLQVLALVGLATLLGWQPDRDVSVPAVGLTTVLGAAAFAGLGLTMAGTLRPEAALVGANLLFLLALGFSGALLPVAELPSPIPTILGLLPVGALTDAFHAALGSETDIVRPLAILGAWAVGSLVVAARTFRWD